MTARPDLESNLIELEADLNVLEHLIKNYESASAPDEHMAIWWTVGKLRPNMERIKAYLYERWHEETARNRATAA